jgi:hypothetical protein
VAYVMLVDRARQRDDVVELQRVWASDPDALRPPYVDSLEEALAAPAPVLRPLERPARAVPRSPSPVPPPEQTGGTDLVALANLVDLANRTM